MYMSVCCLFAGDSERSLAIWMMHTDITNNKVVLYIPHYWYDQGNWCNVSAHTVAQHGERHHRSKVATNAHSWRLKGCKKIPGHTTNALKILTTAPMP